MAPSMAESEGTESSSAAQKGRCYDCGLLGGRPPQTLQYYELSKEMRFQGKVFRYSSDPVNIASEEVEPACIAEAANILFEIKQWKHEYTGKGRADNDLLEEGASIVMDKDRKCPHWFKYQPTFSPREHLEEYKMQSLEQERRKFEKELFELGQRVQTESAKQTRDNKVVAIIVGIVVVILMLMQLVEVWYFSKRPAPAPQQPVQEQQQPQPEPTQSIR
jgi:hypothetical protein